MICTAIDVLYSNVDWVTWTFDDEKDDENDDVDRTDCESYCFCVGGVPVPSICFEDDDDDDVYSDYYYWYCAESLYREHLGTWIDADDEGGWWYRSHYHHHHYHHSAGIRE